jgi:signal transduction histidine kinase
VEERHTLRRAGDELRYLARRLRSRDLEAVDLERALRTRVGEFAERTGIDARVQAGIVDASLGAAVEHATFRFVQEALANVEKHSGAAHVTVDLALFDGELRCSVADDGSGFNPSEIAPRQESGEAIGLLSMTERAKALGGNLCIESAPGSATRVTLAVPVPGRATTRRPSP